MRLTDVAHMALPPGRLLSYAVRPRGEPGSRRPVSFDQARHVGRGQRPGSWMAIAARLPHEVPVDLPLDTVAAAWFEVVARHATFRTAFTRDGDGELQLHEIQVQPGAWIEHPIPDGVGTRDVLRAVLDQACAPFERPSHRLALVIPDSAESDRRPVMIIGADHAHVDMWSLLIVLRDFFSALDDLGAKRPPTPLLRTAAGFAEHSAALAVRPPAPDHVHRRWADILAAEGGRMPTFPLPLGTPDAARDSIVEVRDLLDAAECERVADLARARGLRLISLVLSVLTRATRDLADAPLRAIFPVHSRDEERWRDSVGWYITNSVIESDDPDPAACASAIAEAIALGSHPLGPILAPYGGMPVGPGMFALSWLDTRRLPLVPAGSDVQYVSAAIPDDGVMVWFVVNDAGLHLRARYPDTPQASVNVTAWLDAVARGLRCLVG